jgi:hypothetical protein
MEYIKLSDAIGKRLTGYTDTCEDRLLFTFADDNQYSSLLLSACNDGNTSVYEEDIGTSGLISNFDDSFLTQHGFFATEELQELRAEKADRERIEQENRERWQYERLKQKFEGANPAP